MKTAVMTDTNSGITVEEGKELGIFVLPMPVIVEGRDYLEGVNITAKELYRAIREGKNVCTSQPSPDDLLQMWQSILDQGYDEIVHVPMSSGLSSSCEMAQSFARDFEGRVFVADNHRIAVTLRDSVIEAKAMADQGCTAEEIRDHLDKTGSDSRIFIAVHTLDLLKKSGRITPAAAAIASVFHIIPILSIKEGKLDAFAKARGVNRCEKMICEAVQKEIDAHFAQDDPSHVWIGVAGTFEEQEDADRWFDTVKKHFPGYNIYYNSLSCSIACHVSINSIGIGICRR